MNEREYYWGHSTSDGLSNRNMLDWAEAWWHNVGATVSAYILRYVGDESQYYICASSPLKRNNKDNIGPFQSLEAARVMYVFLYGGSL